jgi:hypothetical protein
VAGTGKKYTQQKKIQCLKLDGMIKQGLVQFFDGDNKLQLPRSLQDLHGMSSLLYDVMQAIHDPTETDKPEVVVYDASKMQDGLIKKKINVEVLAIGNDDYSFTCMLDPGKLNNARKDAHAIKKAFSTLGANVEIMEDVKGASTLKRKVLKWAKSRLAPDIQQDVRVVFVFWAGHAFYSNGATRILPPGPDCTIDELLPEDTIPVNFLVKTVREQSKKCKLIICLDSCRTQVHFEESSQWASVTRDKDKGSDADSFDGLEIWYSTAHGETADDGINNDCSESHSPFTSSFLECLKGNLDNKTFHDIWNKVQTNMQLVSSDQKPHRYTTTLSEHETLLPPVLVPERVLDTTSVRLPMIFSAFDE